MAVTRTEGTRPVEHYGEAPEKVREDHRSTLAQLVRRYLLPCRDDGLSVVEEWLAGEQRPEPGPADWNGLIVSVLRDLETVAVRIPHERFLVEGNRRAFETWLRDWVSLKYEGPLRSVSRDGFHHLSASILSLGTTAQEDDATGFEFEDEVIKAVSSDWLLPILVKMEFLLPLDQDELGALAGEIDISKRRRMIESLLIAHLGPSTRLSDTRDVACDFIARQDKRWMDLARQVEGATNMRLVEETYAKTAARLMPASDVCGHYLGLLAASNLFAIPKRLVELRSRRHQSPECAECRNISKAFERLGTADLRVIERFVREVLCLPSESWAEILDEVNLYATWRENLVELLDALRFGGLQEDAVVRDAREHTPATRLTQLLERHVTRWRELRRHVRDSLIEEAGLEFCELRESYRDLILREVYTAYRSTIRDHLKNRPTRPESLSRSGIRVVAARSVVPADEKGPWSALEKALRNCTAAQEPWLRLSCRRLAEGRFENLAARLRKATATSLQEAVSTLAKCHDKQQLLRSRIQVRAISALRPENHPGDDAAEMAEQEQLLSTLKNMQRQMQQARALLLTSEKMGQRAISYIVEMPLSTVRRRMAQARILPVCEAADEAFRDLTKREQLLMYTAGGNGHLAAMFRSATEKMALICGVNEAVDDEKLDSLIVDQGLGPAEATRNLHQLWHGRDMANAFGCRDRFVQLIQEAGALRGHLLGRGAMVAAGLDERTVVEYEEALERCMRLRTLISGKVNSHRSRGRRT